MNRRARGRKDGELDRARAACYPSYMKTDWRRKKTWDAAGLVLTIAWFAYFAIATGADLAHPLT